MTCGAYTYSSRGRQGVGVVQPQSGLDYPFIAPSDDIRYLVADLYLEYEDDGPAIQHPLRIKWLYGVGCVDNSAIAGMPTPVNAADILIVDSNDTVVFDSTAADQQRDGQELSDPPTAKVFTTKAWGADYTIYEWRGLCSVCRLVAYKTWAPDDNETQNYLKHLAPTAAVIDERAVYRMPSRVTSLTVLTNTLRKTAVNFVSGYNFETSTAAKPRGLRRGNNIVFNAVPGAGFGKYSDCGDTEQPLVCINGICKPNILLEGGDCIWFKTRGAVHPPTQKFVPLKDNAASLVQEIRSNCPACCACSDYVTTGLYMNSVGGVYETIGTESNAVLIQHNNNIERWIDQRTCRQREPIKIAMTPQRCPTIDIVVQYCNLCDECAEDVVINMAISTLPSGVSASGYVEQCYTIMSTATDKNIRALVQGTWPNFRVNFGRVSIGNSASITYRLHVLPPGPRAIKVTATGTYKKNGVTTPIYSGCNAADGAAVARQSRPLACNTDGTTNTVC